MELPQCHCHSYSTVMVSCSVWVWWFKVLSVCNMVATAPSRPPSLRRCQVGVWVRCL
jgi:hypothetical protein